MIHTPYYGFNFQWMYWKEWGSEQRPLPADERALDFLARFGFNFVRIPTSYWFWVDDFNYYQPKEDVLTVIDSYLAACQQRGLHMSLNLHRAPGYCINGNDLEKHNLWLDAKAQDAFVWMWEMFARRYQGIASSDLSFDLLNEPPAIEQYGLTRDNHAALIRRTVAAIRAIDPRRDIVIDGLDGGNLAMPELADLGIVHSGRGYQPQNVSHYLAEWWPEWEGQPEPVYPGTQFKGLTWNRDTLVDFYQPWRDVEAEGATVHIGEFGCYNQTPNEVALRWFTDLLNVYRSFGWGYSLWEFKGTFGIIEHGRSGTAYETIDGYQVDRHLLNLLLENRLEATTQHSSVLR